MNEKIFKSGITELKKEKLTVEEKGAILNRIGSVSGRNFSPIKTPYFTLFDYWQIKRTYSYMTLGLIFVALTGSGVSFAAENSLPGDILYPIKINITEPIRDSVIVSKSAKVDWQIAKVDRRLSEVKKLIEEDKIMPAEQEIALENFGHSVDSFKVAENVLQGENKEQAFEMEKKLVSRIESHIKYFERLQINSESERGEQIREVEKTASRIFDRASLVSPTTIGSSESTTDKAEDKDIQKSDEKDVLPKQDNKDEQDGTINSSSEHGEVSDSEDVKETDFQNEMDGLDVEREKSTEENFNNETHKERRKALRDSIIEKAYETINGLPAHD